MATNNIINWSKPLPLFRAYPSADIPNVTGDATTYQLILNTAEFDTTTSYNTGTGIYTIPKTGYWFFYLNVLCTGLTAGVHASSQVNILSGATVISGFFILATHTVVSLTTSCVTYQAAGAQISANVTVLGGTKTVDIGSSAGLTSFGGYLINT